MLGAPVPRLSTRAIPSVDPWVAGEMFVSPHIEERRRGFNILFGSDVARRSPLTPQLLASRVEEPDPALRAQIIHALADYFEIRGDDYRYPPEMRGAVVELLRKFERPHIQALVELRSAARAGAILVRSESLACLLERVPNASALLCRMAGDRLLSTELRLTAIELIGQVGFMDALAALEGIEARLEGRRAGQLTMTFAPSDQPEDQELLPALKETLRALRENV
jgi:hypothetical protein